MIFLIEYDRGTGHLVSFRRFSDEQQTEANETRLSLEIELSRRNVHHEVVLLEAESEAAVRKTHRRYFENLSELSSTP